MTQTIKDVCCTMWSWKYKLNVQICHEKAEYCMGSGSAITLLAVFQARNNEMGAYFRSEKKKHGSQLQ